MYKKIYAIVFISFFILLISLPAVKHLIKEDDLKSGENRLLTQKPKFPENYQDWNLFSTSIDSYLSDQFGFRKNFISGANKVKYKLFNETNSKQITIGKNGYFYFNSHGAANPNIIIKSVCDIAPLPDKFLQKTKQYFSDFVAYSESKGIHTNIAIIPTKSRIYPEYLPTVERVWCNRNMQTKLEEMLTSISSFKLYYPLEKMLELKSNIQVYLPKHFHWHGKAPYILAEDMMKSLWGITPEFEVKEEIIEDQSDLRLYFKGLHFYEESVSYDYSKLGITKCVGNGCFEELKQIYQHNITYRYQNSHANNQRKLVILSDSFGSYIGANFSRGFSEVILIDINNLQPDEQLGFYNWVTNKLKPSHMLYLLHDGGIYGRTIMLERMMNDLHQQSEIH
jgi:hypothetical protein